MVDHVEPGTVDYIDDLDPLIPQESGTQVAYANDNLRNIKKAVQQSFPNVAGVVAADHTELGYCDGVTSAIQTQLDDKASKTTGVLDDIAVDTDLIVGDTAGSHVGINQASPAYDLHVGDDGGANTSAVYIEGGATGFSRLHFGDAAATSARISVDNASGTCSLTNANTQSIIFWTNDRVVFNESQNDIDFRVESNTDANAIYLDAGNDQIGLFQGTPLAELHVGDDNTGNTTTLRLEAGSATGASVIELGDSTVQYTIRHLSSTNEVNVLQGSIDRLTLKGAEAVFNDDSSTYDFRVESNNQTHMLFVDGTNNRVGVGQASPQTTLHVGDDTTTNSSVVRVESGGTSGKSWVMLGDSSGTPSSLEHDNSNDELTINHDSNAAITFLAGQVRVNPENLNYDFHVRGNTSNVILWCDAGQANVGIKTTTPNASAALDVNGPIYQRGSQIHADYVFDHGYEIMDIDSHANQMWTYGRLPKMPESEVGEDGKAVVDVVQHMMGILEELELAHVYIEDLQRQIMELKNK